MDIGTGMTAQDIFERGARHVFAQGKRAVDEHGSCCYRAADGSRCVVGAEIGDDEYVPGMEGKPADRLIAAFGIERLFPHAGLLQDMQQVHDIESNWTSGGAMRHALRVVAERHAIDAGFLSGLRFARAG